MPERHEFFDHTADLGVRIWGVTLEELFRNAAAALYEALGTFTFRVDSTDKAHRTLTLQADTMEDLLHDWLAELLFDFEAHHRLYHEIQIPELDSQHLTAILSGGTVDFSRSQTRQEIKAVTYHKLAVEHLPAGRWQATLVLDV